MEQFDVSKTPVRQAIQALMAESVLAGHPGKGVYVTGVSVAETENGLPDWARKVIEDVQGLKADVAELQGQRGGKRPARKQERANEHSG